MNSKNAVLTALLLFFITLEVLIALDYVSSQKDLKHTRSSIYLGITGLQNQIGYVGLIHNFKNAILRPEEVGYREKAFENYKMATMHLGEIEKQAALVLGDISLQSTRDMLTAYKERLVILPELQRKKMTVRELDNYLRYDDEPSRIEIKLITEKIYLSLESTMENSLYSSLRFALIVLMALLFTLVAIIRFFFKDQQQALKQSKTLNKDMEKHRADMERSQAILLSVMQDVEKEKLQATKLNEQLIAKNKEMEQFIYTVSHDLRSPLVTIAAFTQKLKTELADSLTTKQAYKLGRILDNVNNMEALLVDLLDLSRIVQQAISTTQLDVKAIVEQQLRALEEQVTAANVTIDIAEQLHSVNANKRLLSQGILNLLSNAIRYREPSRPLIIEIFTTTVSAKTTIHVKDNGIGIDSKYHELIFGIFEKLSTTQGTGVGLTVIQTIMDKHNGKVLIDSTIGIGSCFSLEFPDTNNFKNEANFDEVGIEKTD